MLHSISQPAGPSSLCFCLTPESSWFCNSGPRAVCGSDCGPPGVHTTSRDMQLHVFLKESISRFKIFNLYAYSLKNRTICEQAYGRLILPSLALVILFSCLRKEKCNFHLPNGEKSVIHEMR